MPPDMYRDVRKKLLAVMILVPVVPFLASLAIGYHSYRKSMEQAAVTIVERIAADHAVLITTFLDERIVDLELLLCSEGSGRLVHKQELEKILKMLKRSSQAFIDLGLINAEGDQVAYAGPYDLTGKNYSHEAWYMQAVKRKSYVSDVYLGYRRKPHFVVAATALQNGESWMLRATVDQDVFGNLVEGISLGRTGEAFIVNGDGKLQTTKRTGGQLLETVPEADLFKNAAPFKATMAGDSILTVVPLNRGKWRFIVRQNLDEVLQELDWTVMSIALVSLAGGGLIIFLAFTQSGGVVSMLRRKEEERLAMETHLMRAARLAELGEMSAGFAHEINNPLQIMTSEIALMEITAMEDGEDAPVEGQGKADLLDGLSQLKKQIERCSVITRSILKFGRHVDPETTSLNLAEFLPEICNMVSRKAYVSGIHLSCAVPGDIPPVKADAGQLQQVLLNLLNNALQAVEERHENGGGKLSISAELTPQDNVAVYMADNGCGISPENLERIFNPFFTTKPPGKGTGLGLSVCHAIITSMGGSITVDSKPNQGALFTVTLPKG